jgi:hypothetical protein
LFIVWFFLRSFYWFFGFVFGGLGELGVPWFFFFHGWMEEHCRKQMRERERERERERDDAKSQSCLLWHNTSSSLFFHKRLHTKQRRRRRRRRQDTQTHGPTSLLFHELHPLDVKLIILSYAISFITRM